MCMSTVEISGLVSGPALARTYSHPSYTDAWECVQDYHAVLDHRDRNPQVGPSKIANALDLPRSRVRPWLNGSTPDPVRAIQAARERGWLDMEFNDRTFQGLNVLVAWILSGGSLNSNFVPQLAVSDEQDERRVDAAFDAVGVEYDFLRGGDSQRATEYRPIEEASLLGRILRVLDAPLGRKNEEARIVLPHYLADAPRTIRQSFIRTYLNNRGHLNDNNGVLRFREDRADRYLQSLASLIHETTGERVSVSEKNVIVAPDAAAVVDSWGPPLK